MAPRTLRIPDDLETMLRVAASLQGVSVQAYTIAAIRAQILRDAKGTKGAALATLLDGQAKKAR